MFHNIYVFVNLFASLFILLFPAHPRADNIEIFDILDYRKTIYHLVIYHVPFIGSFGYFIIILLSKFTFLLHISKKSSTFAASKVKERKITMKAALQQNPVFNPMQIHLLKMFSVDKAEKGLIELKDVLYNELY